MSLHESLRALEKIAREHARVSANAGMNGVCEDFLEIATGLLLLIESDRQEVAPVAWIAPSSLESLRICRNDDMNGFVKVWMRADDERTIPLFTGQTSDARDAARYRWLKSNAPDAHMWSDESIDAAMRQEAE